MTDNNKELEKQMVKNWAYQSERIQLECVNMTDC